jgi:hypothetical protein
MKSAPLNRRSGAPALRVTLEWAAAYALALAFLAVWSRLPYWLQIPLVGFVLPIVVYVSTPIGTCFRAWEYLSGYLLLHRPAPGAPLALHLGTSYDLLWRLRPARRDGETLSAALHRELYTGLHRFCREVERGAIPGETRVTACSYFLTGKQMARYGFHPASTPWFTKLSFVLGYPEVLAQQWLLTGRVRLFNPLAVRAYHSTAGEVASRAEYFARLAARSGAPSNAEA